MEAKISPELSRYFARLGSKGGRANSDAQTLARQINGRLGGYPKGRPRTKPKPALACLGKEPASNPAEASAPVPVMS